MDLGQTIEQTRSSSNRMESVVLGRGEHTLRLHLPQKSEDLILLSEGQLIWVLGGAKGKFGPI